MRDTKLEFVFWLFVFCRNIYVANIHRKGVWRFSEGFASEKYGEMANALFTSSSTCLRPCNLQIFSRLDWCVSQENRSCSASIIMSFRSRLKAYLFWKGLSSLTIFISWLFSVVQTQLFPWFVVLDKAYCSKRLRVCFGEIKRYKSYFIIIIISRGTRCRYWLLRKNRLIFANKVSYERSPWGVVPSLIFIGLTGLIFLFLLRTTPTSVRSI